MTKAEIRERLKQIGEQVVALEDEERALEEQLATLVSPFAPGARVVLKRKNGVVTYEVVRAIRGFMECPDLLVRLVRKDGSLGAERKLGWYYVENLRPAT